MEFEVLIIGSDINAYYMARCYHEAYNKKAYLIAKQKMLFTSASNITNIKYVEDLLDNNVFISTMLNFADEHPNKKIVLIGTNDTYVKMISENRGVLKEKFLFNYPSIEMINNLIVKDNFYNVFKDSNLDFPKTFIYSCINKEELPNDLMYPIILKPGDGVEYYQCDFPSKSKVFKLKSEEELINTIKEIEDSGYKANLIIQEFIPGEDSALYDSLFYCDKSGIPKIMTFAQIGLQEQTRSGVGNCTVLVNGFDENGFNEEIVLKLEQFMKEIKFTGFAEFDLKYDYRDGKYKVLEINPRQSRSGYYMSACGANLVKLLVDDLVFNKEIERKILKEEIVLSFVPLYVIKKYIKSQKLVNKILEINKTIDPLFYKKDISFKRMAYLFLRKFNYIKKYKQFKW